MAPYDSMSDEELMEKYYECDDDAFAELYNRYFDCLAAWALGVLKSAGKPKVGKKEKASDLTQDTMVKVAMTKAQPSLRWKPEKGPVSPWIWTIDRNVVFEYLRRKHGIEICESDFRGPDDSESSGRVPEAISSEPGPLQALLAKEKARLVRECVDELPEPHRSVIFWIHIVGLKQTVVARILGVADSTVLKTRLGAYALLAGCLRRKGVIE